MERKPNARKIANAVIFSEVVAQLAAGRVVKLKPKGASMYPTIREASDVIFIRPCNVESVGNGDVVLAHLADGAFVVHRIIGATADCLTLMGDGNIYGTEQCLRSAVCGVVTEIERNGRRMPLPSPSRARVRRSIERLKLRVPRLRKIYSKLKNKKI